MNGLEDKGKGTLELLDNGLDEGSEVWLLCWSRVVEVLEKDCDDFGVGVSLKGEATLGENKLEFPVVCDDTIVDYCELVGWV